MKGAVVWTAGSRPHDSVMQAARRLRQNNCRLELLFDGPPPRTSGQFHTITRVPAPSVQTVRRVFEESADWVFVVSMACSMHPLSLLRMLAAATDAPGLVQARPFPLESTDMDRERTQFPHCLLIPAHVWNSSAAVDHLKGMDWMLDFLHQASQAGITLRTCGNAYVLPLCETITIAHGTPAEAGFA